MSGVRERPGTHAVVAAACVGNFLEFYNFMAYAFFAPMIGHAFFPEGGGGLMNLLYALMTFAVGFVMRPLGALAVGRFAWRHGQQAALMLTFSMMAVGSLLIAATPPASRIGVVAPVLIVLARMLQGFSDGGEVGPATSLLFDSAPEGQGGVFGSLQYMTQLLGSLLAVLFGLGLSLILPQEALFSWGWRIPFFLGLAIVPLGMVLRRRAIGHVEPAPTPARPVTEEERVHIRKVIFLVFLTITSGTIGTYLRNFGVSYAVSVLHLAPSIGMLSMAVGLAAGCVGLAVGMKLAARSSDPNIFIVGVTALCTVLAPIFYYYAIHVPGLASQLALNVTLFTFSSLVAVSFWKVMLETLPAHSRSFVFGVVYALAVSIFGGLTQPFVTWLIAVTHDPLVPGYMMAVVTPLGLVGYLRLSGIRQRQGSFPLLSQGALAERPLT